MRPIASSYLMRLQGMGSHHQSQKPRSTPDGQRGADFAVGRRSLSLAPPLKRKSERDLQMDMTVVATHYSLPLPADFFFQTWRSGTQPSTHAGQPCTRWALPPGLGSRRCRLYFLYESCESGPLIPSCRSASSASEPRHGLAVTDDCSQPPLWW